VWRAVCDLSGVTKRRVRLSEEARAGYFFLRGERRARRDCNERGDVLFFSTDPL